MQTKILLASILISLLPSCASNDVESMLPQDGPTMKEVYDHHFTGQAIPKHSNDGKDSDQTLKENETNASINDVSIERRPLPADYNLSGYTREADNEINQLFPRLSNPTLIIYIYPHLSGSERHPVPGYSSAFTLYEKVEYALPGEPEARY